MIYYMDLPSEIYSICVVWWWNLWLSAFLQWKRAVKHSGSMKKKQKKKHTALSAAAFVQLGRRDDVYEGVVQTPHHRLSAWSSRWLGIHYSSQPDLQ